MPNLIPLPAEHFIRKGLLIRDVTPTYAYENGQKTDRLDGHRYEAVSESAGYVTFGVKVLGDKPTITKEMLEAAEDSTIRVMPNDFRFAFREDKGGLYRLVVTASDLVIVPDGKASDDGKALRLGTKPQQ